MKQSRSFGSRIRRLFISGLLVVVPLVVTYVVLRWLFQAVDGILAPAVKAVAGKDIPGVGILATLLIVMITGWITANVAGARLVRMWEGWLVRLPLIRVVYGAAKQFLESVSGHEATSFKQVGVIEYPRKGVYQVCFVANRLTVELRRDTGNWITVFVPSTPTPFTGFVVIVRAEEFIPLDLPVEEGIKLVVSGGIVVPRQLKEQSPESGA